MNCEQVRRCLTALEQGELEEERAQSVMAHIQQCADCAGDQREMEVGATLLRSLEPEEVPEGFVEKVMRRLPEQRNWEVWGWKWKMALGGGMAVVAGGFLLLGVFLGRMETGRTLALAPEKQMAPTARFKGAAPAEGLGAEGPMVGVSPSEGPAAPREGAQGPFGVKGQPPVATGRGAGFMAEIIAPAPVRRERKGATLLAAAPQPTRALGRGEGAAALPAAGPGVSAPTAPPGPTGPMGTAPMAKAGVASEREDGRADEEAPAEALATAGAGEERRFDLTLKGADLVDALRLVASVEQRSLVVGPGVKGTVTVRMRNVTADEALEKLKKEFRLSVETRDSTMVVKRLDENSSVSGNTAIG